MSWATIIAVYFLFWWLSLFVVLPIGVRRDDQVIEGNDRGAPARPLLKQKFLGTTCLAVVLTFVFVQAVNMGWISWESFYGVRSNL